MHIKLYITLLFYLYQIIEEIYNDIKEHLENSIKGKKKYSSFSYIQEQEIGNSYVFFKEFSQNDKENYSLSIIKYYTNLFKHPKTLVHTHHPKILMKLDDKYKCDFLEKGCVEKGDINNNYFDDNDIIKFFKRDINSKKELEESLINKLYNRPDVDVLLSDIMVLTEKFCCIINDFVKNIKANEAIHQRYIIDNYNSRI